ncbi:MAG TPA: SGNH/GDSL hydrolase family protein [Gemmatimonadaceae bacterium]|nr:SGNH/GDSL hydrolase family protein [Gemmatimonadaceae bacterium]
MKPAVRLLLMLIVAVACAPAPRTAGEARATTPLRRIPIQVDRAEAEIRAFEASDRIAPPAPGGIVFVGSSSIRLWRSLETDFPRLPVLNRGFGGSTLPEAIHYLPRAVLPYRPRTIVLYEGDNDLTFGWGPTRIADDYRTFVRTVRDALPSTRIVFISLKPSPSRWHLVDQQREANRLVREIVARDTLQTFVDVFTPMLGANGRPRPELFVSDSLHMTPAGYAVWRAQVAPVLR